MDADVNCRISKASTVYQCLQIIWSKSIVDTKTKLWLYQAIVILTAIYASETWTIESSQVSFIYIKLYKIQIVSKQVYSVKQENSLSIKKEENNKQSIFSAWCGLIPG